MCIRPTKAANPSLIRRSEVKEGQGRSRKVSEGLGKPYAPDFDTGVIKEALRRLRCFTSFTLIISYPSLSPSHVAELERRRAAFERRRSALFCCVVMLCQVFVKGGGGGWHRALFLFFFFFFWAVSFAAAGGEADGSAVAAMPPRSRCPGAEEATSLYLDTEMGSATRCRKGKNREGCGGWGGGGLSTVLSITAV